LFNIYTSDFHEVIGHEYFKISYVDDSYVATSCHPKDFGIYRQGLEAMLARHFGWLKSLGILVNPTKTEYIVFHPPQCKPSWNDPLLIDNCKVYPTKNLKILGVHFTENLNWGKHINAAINKANSLMYALRCLNTRLSRNRFRTLIYSHFLSRLTYASQVWSGSMSSNNKKRLESCFFKVIRLLCRDFKGRKGRDQLLLDSGVTSLRSTFVIRDAKLLHTFCSTLTPEPIIECLLSQCHFIARRGNRLFFHDYSTKKIGRNSFINRSKYISELIPFEWTNLKCHAFYAEIKSITPPSLRLT